MKDALEGHPDQLFLQTLATDYSELVRTANLRLEQCALMVSKGNEFQAVQLAEVHPPLLDLVTTLSFPGLDKWKNLCNTRNLKLPERIDEKSVRILNDVYQKGLSPTHPLYKQYRAAMFDRNDEAALEVLLTITRMNSSDQVAKSELDRLRNRVIEKKIQVLQTTIDEGQAQEAINLLDYLDRISTTLPEAPAIHSARHLQFQQTQQAAVAQCMELIAQLQPFQHNEDIKPALPMLETVFARRIDLNLTFPPETEELFQNPDSWLSTLRSRALSMALDDVRTGELDSWIEAHTADLENVTKLPGPDLQRLKEEAKNLYAQIQHPIEATRKRADKVINGIRHVQAERRRVRKLKAISIASGVSIFVLAIFYLVIAYIQSSNFKKELAAGKTAGHVTRVGELLNDNTGFTKLMRPFVFESTLDPYKLWITDSTARLSTIQTLLTTLEARSAAGFTKYPPDELAEQIKEMKKDFQELPDGIRSEVADRVSHLSDQWDDFNKHQVKEMAANFSTLLDQAQKLIDSIDYNKSVVSQKDTEAKLEAISNNLSTIASNPAIQSDIDSATNDRLQKIQLKSTDLAKEFSLILNLDGKLKAATTPEEYATLLRLLADVHFGNEEPVRLARDIVQHGQLISDPVGELLMPGNPDGWNTFKQNPDVAPTPPDATQIEISSIIDLRNNPFLQNIYLHTVHFYPSVQSISKPQTTRILYSKGELPKPLERTDLKRRGDQNDHDLIWSGEFYDPAANEDIPSFDQKDIRGFENLQDKIAEGNLISESVLAPDSEAFARLGIDRVFDPAKKVFDRPLLSILDQIRQSPDMSSIMRAYVYTQIVNIMEQRPQAWGLYLVPSLDHHLTKLKNLLQAPLAASDWLLPSRKKQYETTLKNYFASLSKEPDYLTQFKFHRSLFSQTLKGGVKHAGYVGLDGKPVLVGPGIGAKEIWGINKDDSSIVLLYTWDDAKNGHEMKAAPHLLSPLLVFGTDRTQVLKDAARDAEISDRLPIYLPYVPNYFK